MLSPEMRQHPDIIIAGGGGSGCLAAWKLVQAGLRVLVVERGGPAQPDWRSLARVRRDPSIRLLDRDDPDWRYGTGRPGAGEGYNWLRATGVGGRLNHWLGTSLRFEPQDFADARLPGLQWPLTFADLEAHYKEVESELGVSDAASPGPPSDPIDDWIATAAQRCGTRSLPARQAFTSAVRRPNGLPASFSPLDRWVPEAVATGRCVVLPRTVVRRVLTSGGRACGVEVVNAESDQTATLRAEAVVLATSPIETARVLLESASAEQPSGLGNHSGLVGQGLMDHVVVWAEAFVSVPSSEWVTERALQTCYVPDFGTEGSQHTPPSRFHVQVFARDVSDMGLLTDPGVGQRTVRIRLAGVGEGLPLPGNEVILDASRRRDAYGNVIPVVRFRWDDAHERFGRRIHRSLLDLLEALPGEVIKITDEENDARPAVGGAAHEVGGARMGKDPDTSVVSPRCEVHGVEKLFVVDGSSFVSYPDKNPALTMLANCARVCDEMSARR